MSDDDNDNVREGRFGEPLPPVPEEFYPDEAQEIPSPFTGDQSDREEFERIAESVRRELHKHNIHGPIVVVRYDPGDDAGDLNSMQSQRATALHHAKGILDGTQGKRESKPFAAGGVPPISVDDLIRVSEYILKGQQ